MKKIPAVLKMFILVPMIQSTHKKKKIPNFSSTLEIVSIFLQKKHIFPRAKCALWHVKMAPENLKK